MRSKYRLWVLSRAYKNLLTGWFKLPDEAVHHIDRYELFSARDAAWKLQQAGTLVYAGREASGKNTKLLLHVLSRLQEQDVRQAKKIIFCGDLPRTAKEAKSLKWKHPPVFLGDLKSRWINIRASRPAFISLSTYLFDDFSVAAAEAQQQGWPVIIPGWNGFLDIQGSEVYRLRSDWIQNCFSEDAVANHTAFDHLYRKVRGLLDEKAADCVALKQLGEGKKFCPEWISGRDIRKKIEQLDIKSRVQLAVSFGPPVFSKPQSFRRIEELLGGGEDRF